MARHQAGEPMALRETTPEILGDQIACTIDQPVVWPEIDVDGARNAAGLVCEIL